MGLAYAWRRRIGEGAEGCGCVEKMEEEDGAVLCEDCCVVDDEEERS